MVAGLPRRSLGEGGSSIFALHFLLSMLGNKAPTKFDVPLARPVLSRNQSIMFGSNPKNDPPVPATPSNPLPPRTERPGDASGRTRTGGVLSSGVSINGDVTFGTELVIDGEITGNVTSSGALMVGEHSRIIGNITVGSVTVHGTVEGNISVSERCTLAAGATLRGDIAAPRLAVDENATFLGSARITSKPR